MLPKHFHSGGDGGKVCDTGEPVGKLPDREYADARLVQMDAVAVPDLVGTIAHAFIQEGIIRLVGGGANLFCVNGFRPLPEDIGDGDAAFIGREDRDRGFHPERHAISRMADILALGVIGGHIIGLDAEGEIIKELRREAAAQLVGLARLVARGQFHHIDREIARFQEHRRKHVLSFDLLEGERAGIGGPDAMVRSAGGGAGLPERGSLESRLIAAFFEAAVHLRRPPVVEGVRMYAQQADALAM